MTDEPDMPPSMEEQAAGWALEVGHDPEKLVQAEAWCAADPARRAAFERSRAMLGRMDPALHGLYEKGLLLQIGNPRPVSQETHAPPKPSYWKYAIAACLGGLVIAGLAISAIGRSQVSIQPQSPPALVPTDDDTPQVLITRAGEVRNAILTDGSRVILDTDTKLLVWIDHGRRKLELDHGRARFDVAHDPSRPFTVSVDGATVTALGTMFDVERRSHCQVKVLLLRGKVAVSPPCRANGKVTDVARRELKAGERIVFADAVVTQPQAQPEPAPASDSQWASGLKNYSDVPLKEVLAEVNLYTPRPIMIASPDIGEIRVNAELRIRDTDSVARNLARALGLTVDNSNSNQIMLKK